MKVNKIQKRPVKILFWTLLFQIFRMFVNYNYKSYEHRRTPRLLPQSERFNR